MTQSSSPLLGGGVAARGALSLLGLTLLGGCSAPADAPDSRSQAAAGSVDADDEPPAARCVGMPRPLAEWHGPLRKLAATGDLSKVTAGPTPGGENAWQLCLRDPADADHIEAQLELAIMSAAPSDAPTEPTVAETRRHVVLGSDDGAPWLPAGTLVIAFGGASDSKEPVLVMANGQRIGEVPADSLAPSGQCLPSSAPFRAAGAGEPGDSRAEAIASESEQLRLERGLFIARADDRVVVTFDDVKQEAELVRIQVEPEGCTASSDGAAMVVRGIVGDLTLEGPDVLLHVRDSLDAAAQPSVVVWTPKPGVIDVRHRPEAPDAKALIASLSRLKTPLSAELSGCMRLDQIGEDAEVRFDQRLAEVRRRDRKARVECLAEVEGAPRSCVAEFGDLSNAGGMEVSFEVSDEGLRLTDCLAY